jgi:hypothetical protein
MSNCQIRKKDCTLWSLHISFSMFFLHCDPLTVAFEARYKVKWSLCFNWARRHGGVLGEWKPVVSFTLYPQGKSPWYPLDRRLGRPQSRSGRDSKDKIPSPRRESNPRIPIVQPVAQSYTDWAITAHVRNEVVPHLFFSTTLKRRWVNSVSCAN